MKKYYFKDDDSRLWSVTEEEILKDTRNYLKDFPDLTIEDPFQFFLDNINECEVKWVLEKDVALLKSPHYNNPVLVKIVVDEK